MSRCPMASCRNENGPAASELRRRCAWLHHGPDPARIRPNTRLRRESAPDGELPSVRYKAASLTRRASACPGADRQLTLAHGLVATARVMEGVEHRQTSLTSQVPYKVVDLVVGREEALGLTG